MVIDEIILGNFERKDDGFVVEFKNVFIILKNFDYVGLCYVNLVYIINLNGYNISGDDVMLNNFDFDGVWESESVVFFIGVLDENGEEFVENELILCYWEWIMVVRVLD